VIIDKTIKLRFPFIPEKEPLTVLEQIYMGFSGALNSMSLLVECKISR